MDADTKELGEYFSGKSSYAVTEGLEQLENVIDRARKLSDTLSDNGSLGWRCGVDRCLARNHVNADRSATMCRACKAHDMAQELVKQLDDLATERREAASLAREIQAKRGERD